MRKFLLSLAGVIAIIALSLSALVMLEKPPETKQVSVHTKSRVFEGVLEGTMFRVTLSFNGEKQHYFVRESDNDDKYLISTKEDGYCFLLKETTLLQMPSGTAGCKRNK